MKLIITQETNAANPVQMKVERVKMFNELLALMGECKRVNQWK